MKYDCIRPGKIWLDTSGKPIQAHGFSIFYDEKEKRYYWYGENKEFTKKKGKIWTYGIRCYSSSDFYNWEDCGLIIPPSEDIHSPLHPNHEIDRPHIIYCEKTGKYVCWLKIMAGGKDATCQFMTILHSDSFLGPYEIVHEIYSPCQMNSGDFTLVKKDGKGYILFERPHFELICATLTDTFTETTGEYSAHYENRKPPLTREAPTYFERNGKNYLITSGTSGYFPNPSMVSFFNDFHGDYHDLGDPCIGDRTKTTFNSQVSCVIKIPGKELWVALADRWLPSPLIPMMSGMIIKGMNRVFKDYVPDQSLVKEIHISDEELTHNEATCKSRYVFLPVEWENDRPVLRWKKKWKLEDYK